MDMLKLEHRLLHVVVIVVVNAVKPAGFALSAGVFSEMFLFSSGWDERRPFLLHLGWSSPTVLLTFIAFPLPNFSTLFQGLFLVQLHSK